MDCFYTKTQQILSRRVDLTSQMICLLFSLMSLLGLPQQARSQNSNIVFEHFSIDQGVSGVAVPCILQDRAGYLWFGTLEGIDRYDGYSFTSYKHDPDDTASLVNAFVNTLCEDKAGNIWVGTYAGLDELDRASGKFTHYLPHPSGPGANHGNYVISIHEDRDGLLWVGTNDGLNVFDRSNGKFTCFREDTTDPGGGYDPIQAICEDRTGLLWIGTNLGLNRFDKTSRKFIHVWHVVNQMNYLDNSIHSIYEDASGILWLGGGAGLVAFDQRAGTFTQYTHDPKDPRSISSNRVSSISDDNAGHLWVGTELHGVNVFDKKTKSFTHYVHNAKDPGSLSSNGIFSVYCERSGTIWVSTPDKGINKLNRAKPPFTSYPYDDEAPNTTYPQVFADNDGRMWVHATNEWQKFDPKTESFLRQPIERDSYPLLDDREGNLWIGKESGGLYRRDQRGQTITFHDPAGAGFRQVVYCLIETRDGHFWMGTTDGGLFAVDPGRHSLRRVQQAGSEIENILEDASGLLWIGTWNDGLLCYDPRNETVVRYRYDPKNPASLSANIICTMYEDKTGTLWVGANGLDRFDRMTGSFTHFTVKDGLPSDVVCKILEDDHGNLWLGTFNGISKFDPKTVRFKNYDVSYGLADNAIRIQSGCRTRNGEMYFGGKGLTRFHPDSIRDNLYVPPIVVTQFRLFEKPTPFGDAVSLSHGNNFISFEFAALSYVSPEKNQYAYKMEGIDSGWVQSGTRRYAGYPNLDPGEYVFRVKGSNNDGIWNEKGTSIAVIIIPPYWATWWFRSFAIITMFLAIGGGIRYVEMRKLKRRIELLEQERALEGERLRISQDMHDEVGSALSEITILTELVKKESNGPHNADAHIRKISDRSREVTQSINQIVWAINPKNDPLENFVAYIRHYAVQYFTASPIRCRCDFPETVPDVHLSAEARRNVFLAVKESLHNIVKHSFATEAVITLRNTGAAIEILIEDNGVGFSPGTRSSIGNGLDNMTMRLAQIKGVCEVQSSPGAGTRVRIVFGGS